MNVHHWSHALYCIAESGPIMVRGHPITKYAFADIMVQSRQIIRIINEN